MKRILTLILSVLFAFGLTSCSKPIEGNFTFVAPDGAPALAIAKFINDDENFGTEANFEYSVVSSGAINNAIVSSASDFVVMPLNSATKLYKNKEEDYVMYVMAAVLTHGNFYIMSKADIDDVQDLIGRVVFVPNPGKVPDWTFQAALKGLNIDYQESDQPVSGKVAIKYFNSPQEFNALLIQNPENVGLVPEPAVSVLKGKGVSAVLDLQQMFDAEKSAYPQAVLMVKKSVAEKHPELITKIGNAFSTNVEWVKSNPTLAVNAVKAKFETTSLNPDVINSATVDGCKIFWQSATNAKLEVNAYIQRITQIDQISASIVGDDFFFKG